MRARLLRRPLVVRVTATLGSFAVVACSRSPVRPVDPAPPSPVASVVASPAASSAPSNAASATAPPAVSTAAPSAVSDAKTFACAGARCAVGKESCCFFGPNDGLCIPSVDNPIDQERACERANHGYSITEIARCDESLDCGPTDVCCRQVLHSGASIAECVPPVKGGATPCDWDEECVAGSTCRLPGTVCIDGRCNKPARFACGAETCSGDKPVCCDGNRCSAEADCPGTHRVACRSSADCIQGQFCAVNGEATVCIGAVVSPEHLGVACSRAADCPKCISVRGARPQCGASLIPGINACVCPY